jgi:penicillin-insensitive murein endopeptidase
MFMRAWCSLGVAGLLAACGAAERPTGGTERVRAEAVAPGLGGPMAAGGGSAAPRPQPSASPLSGPVEPPARVSAGVVAAPVTARPSASIGSPTNGALRDGAALPLAGPGFRFNDKRSAEARYGTDEVVAAIARAAERVARELPGGELVVNDLSLRAGGAIPHHGSHRAGRDADILFYLRDDAGTPIPSVGAPLDPRGKGVDFKDLATPADDVPVELDSARTWRFVAALLDDERAVVQRIFVVEHLRTLLLAEAERSGAAPALVQRFAEVTCQPSYPHDDHLHVRWFCTAEDIALGCEESAPIYPWHSSALGQSGVRPVLAKASRSREPAPVTTLAQADQAVRSAAPDAAVLAFLAARKAWEKQPHPGRPYCR